MATADPPPMSDAALAALRSRTTYKSVRRLCAEVVELRAALAGHVATTVAVGHRLADCAELLGRLAERKDRRSK